MKPLTDFQEVLSFLPPRSSVVLHSGCAEPRYLAGELARHAGALEDVHVFTLMPMGEAPYAAAGTEGRLAPVTFHPGKGLRGAANAGRVEVMRTPLGSIPKLFRDRALTANVLMLQLSAPDEKGNMSLGISVDYMRAVLAQKPLVVAEINPLMPRTRGDTVIREHEVDFSAPSRNPPQTTPPQPPEEADRRIAEHVAGLISNGDVIETGIGSVPDLVLGQLGHLRDLGVHTGIITDPLLALIEQGVVTNATKKEFRGKCVTAMAAGTQPFYDALHENPAIEFHPCSLTHDVDRIAGIDGFCAINSVLQIDLAGQANAERMGSRIVSAPGGLPDFARGASLAKGGKSIIALRSTSKDGRHGNILARLAPGTPVAVAAEHIDYVVTEHGVARLTGLDPADRARALTAIAHPDFRADLRRGAGAETS